MQEKVTRNSNFKEKINVQEKELSERVLSQLKFTKHSQHLRRKQQLLGFTLRELTMLTLRKRKHLLSKHIMLTLKRVKLTPGKHTMLTLKKKAASKQAYCADLEKSSF